MNKKNTAINIANYIVEVVNNDLDMKGVLTPIKLQKILYYVYVNCLVNRNEKLFEEPIEKWKFGPVVSHVYHSFKVFGTGHIDSTISTFEFSDEANGGFSFKEVNFDSNSLALKPEVQEEIHSTIKALINEKPFDLVERTHEEDPWKLFEPRILAGERGLVYTDQEIKDFFSKKS
ncbi:Panacea domain-containing protein [Acinetobacter sp. RF14B]|uniref:Panacea domain-containing protein n=1 Tax=Acinetobacter sp. RF14B TaxID=2650965 RepID=UPI001D0DBC95|nr:type II toxin-antitoxin system antitoxin SocA domain-containing protein [Acinetobacter sp. RF14B]